MTWLAKLNRRERMLLGALAGLVLVFLGAELASLYQDRHARIAVLRAAVTAAETAPGEAAAAEPAPWISDAEPSRAALHLQRIIEEASRRHDVLTTSIQSGVEPGGVVSVDAHVEGSLRGLMDLLFAIERADAPLLITDLALARPKPSAAEASDLAAAFTVKGYVR